MNLRELALYVAKEEKGKKEVSIAQIKEVIKLVCIAMYFDEDLIKKMVASGKRHTMKGVDKKKLPSVPKILLK